MKNLFIIILIVTTSLYSKNIIVRGKISDAKTGNSLSYANVLVKNTNKGTSSNFQGEFQLNLESGKYTLIASFIGYKSDTVKVDLSKVNYVEFKLEPVTLELSEVKVVAGENPAHRIIRLAGEKRKKRNDKIESYSFTGFTKGIVKTANDLAAGDASISLSVSSKSDSMYIQGILENESRGYFRSPDEYKEEIIAQQQTANFPASINLFTGNRIIQNFYNNDIEFFGKQLPNPVDWESIGYYYYYLKDSTAIDNEKVYVVFFAPDDDADPGFKGDLFIKDKTFDLLKVDISLNEAANYAGMLDSIRIFQQFVPFRDSIYMPVDYRLFLKGGVLGLVNFAFEMNSIMYDYSINEKLDNDLFDWSVVTVLPEADKKDSAYWAGIQTLPKSLEEVKAYEKIDSIESIKTTFWENFSFITNRLPINDNLYISGPLDIYGFNKVEGHNIGFGVYLRGMDSKRLNADNYINYGFSDENLKYNFRYKYLFGKYRTYSAELKVKDDIDAIFGESIKYNGITSTILSLFTKYDFRDYFYRKGVELKLGGDVLPFLNVRAGYSSYLDKSAINNTDFSFFKKDKKYSPNLQINNVNINSVSFGFTFDFRRFVEDGYFRRRIGGNKTHIVFDGNVTIADESLLNTSTNFQKYNFGFHGRINSYRNTTLFYRTDLNYIEGTAPIQYLSVLPGNISSGGKSNTFRTLKVSEVFGDRSATYFLTYDFADEFFKILSVPYLKDLRILSSIYLNSALVDSDNKQRMYNTFSSTSFKSPFYEAGFSIGYQGFPLQLEFTWKLNYKGKNDFVFGINTFAL